MSPRARRLLVVAGWLVLAAPALYQVWLLITAISGRVAYPYDLEWMEGGLLHHAQRIHDGSGIYVPPSVEFIPYLYTPLYPALLGALGGAAGPTYLMGRMVSVLALLGIAGVATASIAGGTRRAQTADPAGVSGGTGVGIAGTLLALGTFAAGYPYVEGWYDLVRADTLALFMITAGIHCAARWSRLGTGWHGHARIAAVGALMGLAFFVKQTAILYVAWAGLIVWFLAWKRAFTYAVVAGVIGLGGVALLQKATGGWFWTYAFKIHQAHDFNMDRFWRSFGNILWHWPSLTILVVMTLVVVGASTVRGRRLPVAARPFVLWTLTYALSTLVGAIGWGTEFAHFNAYMPALLHGALAVGAAVPALVACAQIWQLPRPPRVLAVPVPDSRLGRLGRLGRTVFRTLPPPSPRPVVRVVARPWIGVAVAAAAVVLVDLVLIGARWKPAKYVPVAADRAAGDKLIAEIRSIPGDVWVPYHPWYAHLAGKRPFVHRMGIRDVTARKPRKVIGLDDAARSHGFSAIVFDNRDPFDDLPAFARGYRPETKLNGRRPRTYTGADVAPDAIWVPVAPLPRPAGTRVVFDFEDARWSPTWSVTGSAWGKLPATRAQNGQTQPRRYGGRAYATSMWGGDKATGRLTSPPFTIDGKTMTLHVAGGTDATKLRIELRIGVVPARTTGVTGTASEDFRVVTWDVADLVGKEATLVLVDDATGSWGHINLDDVWLGP